jgi:hypothetical protein
MLLLFQLFIGFPFYIYK